MAGRDSAAGVPSGREGSDGIEGPAAVGHQGARVEHPLLGRRSTDGLDDAIGGGDQDPVGAGCGIELCRSPGRGIEEPSSDLGRLEASTNEGPNRMSNALKKQPEAGADDSRSDQRDGGKGRHQIALPAPSLGSVDAGSKLVVIHFGSRALGLILRGGRLSSRVAALSRSAGQGIAL